MGNAIDKNKLGGKYKHYKGSEYFAYCIAYDIEGNEYVLYQQCYGDKGFWLRPYSMFFEEVAVDSGMQPRFAPTRSKRQSNTELISKLKEIILEKDIFVKYSENSDEYVVTHIYEVDARVIVQKHSSNNSSGYLTEYELLRRMGFRACRINDEIVFCKSEKEIEDSFQLRIDNNDIESIKQFINPCSIDLQIADAGFLKTRHKTIDPQSIEHYSQADQLWKPVKKYRSKSQSVGYIKIYPHTTVLTHIKNRIRIPKDCAGKIEIKSTFARLSLSVTSGDFCNPGYDGYFPLEIKNNGSHTIIIHENETMVQLMLIPLQGPILDEYKSKATFQNNDGYDDGTPYSFWRERSIKALRKEEGTQRIIDLFYRIIGSITQQNTDDVNEFKNRFNSTFLTFCQKNLYKRRFRNRDTDAIDVSKLLFAYVNKEKRLETLAKINIASNIVSIFIAIIPFLATWVSNSIKLGLKFSQVWYFIPIGILGLLIGIVYRLKKPKIFCTFQKIDLRRILDSL